MNPSFLIDVSDSNNYILSGSVDGDALLYTTDDAQRILIGTQNNVPSVIVGLSNVSINPYVSIGKSNAAYPLDVNGTINATTMYTSNLDVSGTTTVGGHIIPDTTLTYDLGSASNRFRDLYLSGNTIDLGGTRLGRDSTGDVTLTGADGNFKTLKVDQIMLAAGSSNQIIITKDPGSRKLSFIEAIVDNQGTIVASNLVETTNNVAGVLGPDKAVTVAGVSPSFGYSAGTVDVPNIQISTLASDVKTSYGTVILGTSGAYSLSNNAQIILTLAHNLETMDYSVFPTIDDPSILSVKMGGYTSNTFTATIKNTSGGNLLNPAFRYMLVQGVPSVQMSVVAAPVVISSSTQSVTTYSGPTSVSKVINVTGVTDPRNFAISYSVLSNVNGAFSVDGSNLTYQHQKSTGMRTGVLLASNPYNSDPTKTITYNVSESNLMPIAISNQSMQIYTSSTSSATRTYVGLPSTKQGLPLTYTLAPGSTTGLNPAIANTSNVNFSKKGTSGTWTIPLTASFASNVMTEAALSPGALSIGISETYLTPITISNPSVSIYTSSTSPATRSYDLPSTDQGLSMTYTLGTSTTGLNPALTGTTVQFSKKSVSATHSITVTASFASAIMTEAALAAKALTMSIVEKFLTPITLGNTTTTVYSSTSAASTRTIALTESDQGLPVTYTIDTGGTSGLASSISSSNLTITRKKTNGTWSQPLIVSFAQSVMDEAVLTPKQITQSIQEVVLTSPIIASSYSVSISTLNASSYTYTGLPQTNQGLPLTYSIASDPNGLGAYISNGNVVYNSKGANGNYVVNLRASFASSIMTDANLTATTTQLNIAETLAYVVYPNASTNNARTVGMRGGPGDSFSGTDACFDRNGNTSCDIPYFNEAGDPLNGAAPDLTWSCREVNFRLRKIKIKTNGEPPRDFTLTAQYVNDVIFSATSLSTTLLTVTNAVFSGGWWEGTIPYGNGYFNAYNIRISKINPGGYGRMCNIAEVEFWADG